MKCAQMFSTGLPSNVLEMKHPPSFQHEKYMRGTASTYQPSPSACFFQVLEEPGCQEEFWLPVKARSLTLILNTAQTVWRHPDPNIQSHQKTADNLRYITHLLKLDGNVSVGGVIAGESRQESLKGVWMGFDKFPYTKALIQ